ncbi:uroporphyrinogen-III synthase [Sulfurimonas autotrophica]|uniref:Uroporphyrinogen III synthase HEM4 n=1 Tax=Sulfurimonas autotrophica (strain ATCC BAA-671 / DSM 16294 / JCM 11897 / OK10) TaxID=563040 RepID=E0UQ86_SULAO|nr:uroporphyrinogen-III synthase [Sulfurimonas autotrophica]ADN09829.1 Uroporphyrinogen III synthase HEM4 [Sulfurimonas autotrophica DSM 16294]
MRPIYLFSISSHPDAISINSLDITFLQPEIDFSKYDYLIITSKQASKALQEYNKKEYINKPALCISKQSAKSFEDLGGQVLAVGGGYGDNLIEQIKSFPKEKKWLYLRAKIVASDFVFTCKEDGYVIGEKVVYESDCSGAIDNVTVQDDAVLIFTSPSSVKCFLKNHSLLHTHKIIVIGKTTAKAIPKNCSYILSDETTIESCMQIAHSLK